MELEHQTPSTKDQRRQCPVKIGLFLKQLLLFFANHQHEDPEEVASAVSKPKQSLLVLAAAPLPYNVVTPM